MANVRVRYGKAIDGLMGSRRNFVTSTGKEVNVELDTVNMKYRILDAVDSSEVATGGDTISVSVLKIQAKEGLVALGVTFDAEERERGGLTLVEGVG